ncbi:MAG: hypothetical protein ACUVTD_00560 [Nitrososphaerales archaeon]
MGFLGTRAGLSADLNLIMQIIILAILIIGIGYAKKKNFLVHGRIQTVAVILQTILIFTVMLPSLIINFGIVLAELYLTGVLITILHIIFRGIAWILGVISIFRKFRNVKT